MAGKKNTDRGLVVCEYCHVRFPGTPGQKYGRCPECKALVARIAAILDTALPRQTEEQIAAERERRLTRRIGTH